MRIWVRDTPLRAGVSEEALRSFESRYGLFLPPAFRAYLALVDGNEDWVGGRMISFWSLAEIYEEMKTRKVLPGAVATTVPFADFLINSHVYALHIAVGTEAPVVIEHPRIGLRIPCGETFEEFVDLYERDDPRLYR